MAKALWFNPENDLALASNCAAFTPNVAAAQIHNAGAFLPLFFARSCDKVIVPHGSMPYANELIDKLKLKGKVIEQPENKRIVLNLDDIPQPWGWSLYSRQRFLNWGATETNLPSREQLSTLREFSHRKQTQALCAMMGDSSTAPFETSSLNEALSRIKYLSGEAFIKLPFSSSGRGVFDVSALSNKSLESIIASSIRNQGSIMVERRLNPVQNFAMLFKCSPNNVSYCGLSVFSNNRSSYSGNLLASQEELFEIISSLCGRDTLLSTRDKMTNCLNELLKPILSFYNSWIGIDMMVFDLNGQKALAPCVEINLRVTMGVVALKAQEELKLERGTLTMIRKNSISPKRHLNLSPHVGDNDMAFIVDTPNGI